MYVFFRMLIALTLASVLTVGSFLQAPASAHAVVVATDAEHVEQPGVSKDAGLDSQQEVSNRDILMDDIFSSGPFDATRVERSTASILTWDFQTNVTLPRGVDVVTGWQVTNDGGLTWEVLPGTTESLAGLGGSYWRSLQLPEIRWWMNGNMYRVFVTTASGVTAYSQTGTLTVLPGQIVITTDPQDQNVAERAVAAFTARHGGAAAPAEVRWQQSQDGSSWTDIEGARAPIEYDTESRYEIEASSALDGMFYRAVFTNEVSEAVTNGARLTVSPGLPVVSESPLPQSVLEGGAASFTSAYTGTTAPTTATWEQSADGGATWADVPGAPAESTLVVEGVTLDMDGLRYRARYTNAAGSVWTEAATLTVDPVRPVVTEHPVSVSVVAGGAAEFSAAYGGTDAETTVQWQFSTDGGATFNYVPAGVGPNGARSIPLIVDSVTPEMDGWLYRVRFTNAAGSAWSEAATLSVASVWPDASGQAVAGGEVEVWIYSADEPRAGVMEITAPEGTRITSARTNGADLTFLISEDGRTAVSSRAVNPWGGAWPSAWVTLQVDLDAPAGAVLDDGQARIIGDGVLRAVAPIAVEVIAAPGVTQHPQDVSVVEGQNVVLDAAASGHPAPTAQWQSSTDGGSTWSDIDGATGAELHLDAAALEMDGTLYRAVFTNSVGTAVTESARLSVREVRHLNLSVRPIVRLVDAL